MKVLPHLPGLYSSFTRVHCCLYCCCCILVEELSHRSVMRHTIEARGQLDISLRASLSIQLLQKNWQVSNNKYYLDM